MKKERKNKTAPISFEHHDVHVSGGDPGVFHSFDILILLLFALRFLFQIINSFL